MTRNTGRAWHWTGSKPAWSSRCLIWRADDMAGNDLPPSPQRDLRERIGVREQRKLRARKTRDRTVFHGLGAAGIVGWSVAVPTVIGALAGLWLDRSFPG